MNARMLIHITVGPVCKDAAQDMKNPIMKHTSDTDAEQITTPLKLLHIRIDVSAGKITSAEIIMAPIIFIPSTIVTDTRSDISVL